MIFNEPTLILKSFFTFSCILFLLVTPNARSQNQSLTSDNALKQYIAISENMSQSFPEDDIKTFRRSSFSEEQLQVYLSQHFKRMDLLSHIDGNHRLKLNSHFHSGNWFREIGFPKESIKSCEDFFKYYSSQEEKLTESEKKSLFEMKTFTHSILAEGYSKLGRFDLANEEHLKNIQYTKYLDTISYASALNNYGLYFYWHKKELDSSLIYFNLAHQITKKHFPNHTLIGSIRDNIADVYLDQGKSNAALPYYQTNFEFYKVATDERLFTKDIPRLISAGSQLVDTYIQIEEFENAKKAFKELETIMVDSSYLERITSESTLAFLNSKARLYEKQNNFKEAYKTARTIQNYSDSLNTLSELADQKWRDELNNITLDRIALNFKIEQIQKENQIKSQRSKLWFITLLSSFGLIILLSLLLRRRQYFIIAKNKQLLAEQKLENTALKVKQLNSDIKSKERDLSDFAINLTQNQEWTQEVAEKIIAIKQANTSEGEILLSELEQDIQNKITFDTDTQTFFDRLDKLSDSFYRELTTNFPNLSKNEIRLCSLIRLKIGSRSIATLQNITLASLNTSRYRLRKKLHLSEDVELDTFIQNM
ncbi:tetratricopeptide repeat protein [Flavobacteriaceae bacterium MAR_2010_72]|nr:tetratricopeptide repeat protein [Flavobacteriaceae bacterium MAR_2010_72]